MIDGSPQRKKPTFRVTFFVSVGVIAGFIFGVVVANRQNGQSNPLHALEAVSGLAPNAQRVYDGILHAIQTEYAHQPVTNETLFYGAMSGLVRSLGDPYSTFFTPADAQSFQNDLNLSVDGIGAEVGAKDGQLVIIAPLPQSPAEKAGLKPGDAIVQIDGQDTTNLNVDQAVQKIRGKAGTVVKLLIGRNGKTQDISVTRDHVVVPSVTSRTVGDKLQLVTIVSFNDDTVPALNTIIQNILLNKPKGIILDLRNNPGGLLDSAVSVAGEFLGKTVIVRERDAQGKENVDSASHDARIPSTPVVVLVNGGSASAAEILAGALQDAKRATIVGQKTFGKGSVQTLEKLPDGSELKLTIAAWFTPKGRTIDKVGITPDVVVADPTEAGDAKDDQLQRAMQILTPKP